MPAFYEFDGEPFEPTAQDQQPLTSAPTLLYSERHVPYSDLTILDLGGLSARHYTAQIRLYPFQVATFEALIGKSGKLIVANLIWARATLLKLEGHTQTPRGEWHFYNADWAIG